MAKHEIYTCDLCGKPCKPVIGKHQAYGKFSGLHSFEVLNSGHGIILSARVMISGSPDDAKGYDRAHACKRCTLAALKDAVNSIEHEYGEVE